MNMIWVLVANPNRIPGNLSLVGTMAHEEGAAQAPDKIHTQLVRSFALK